MNKGIWKVFAAGIAGAFVLLMLAGAGMTGENILEQRAVGIAGWGLVAAGFLGVTLAVGAGAPRRPQTLLVREPGQETEKMVHSEIYTPPPYRLHYTSSRLRH